MLLPSFAQNKAFFRSLFSPMQPIRESEVYRAFVIGLMSL
jgi:hypothetical protein